jgi:anti-anti-sigma factor
MIAPPFRVTVEELPGGVHVFQVAGELDQATAPDLREPLEDAIARGISAILVDLTDCSFIDSTGLSVLVRAHQSVAQRDGAQPGNGAGPRGFHVCCPDPQVRRVLKISGLDQALTVHDTRDEAEAALNA